MDWGSDELCHRSAELSGWTEELRAADPADVDDSVPGAAEFAAATGAGADGSTDDSGDSTDDAASATRTCGFCRTAVPAAEALDADGFPIGGFEWVGGASDGETEAYHRECVEAGEGRFLAWGASGLLGDD